MPKHNRTAPRITHTTADTGNVQVFSLGADNFDPEALRRTLDLFQRPVLGYMIERGPALGLFMVRHDGHPVSLNEVSQDQAGNISLTTWLMPAADGLPRDHLMMLADLEQCAAIAVLAQLQD